jgi:mRNA-degrading endonuclease YafQ of YafQ-DinJ toxin-antitoxin module
MRLHNYTRQFERDYELVKKRGLDTTLLKAVIDKLLSGQPWGCRKEIKLWFL